MPQENEVLSGRRPIEVQKADMALSDLNSGGVLVRDQLKKFILVQIKGTVVTEKVRVTTMTRESQEIPKMTTFGANVWHPGTESQALTLAQRVKPGFSKVTLTSKEIVCQVDYPRYVLANQVEGPKFKNTLIGYLGLHSKRDIEDLIVNGSTASGSTPFLKMFNGMITGATSNTYAAGAAALGNDELRNTWLTMPSEYDSQSNTQYLTNKVAWSAYDDELAARGTPLGDSRTTGTAALPFKGELVHRVPLFPNALGGGANETVVWYGDPKQFIFAWHENMEMQSEYSIRERVWTVVLTARIAQGYEHEPAVVKTTGVLGQ